MRIMPLVDFLITAVFGAKPHAARASANPLRNFQIQKDFIAGKNNTAIQKGDDELYASSSDQSCIDQIGLAIKALGQKL